MKKYKAVEVVPDKLWIIYDHSGAKSGVLRIDNRQGLYHYISSNGQPNTSYDIDEIEKVFDFQGRSEVSSWHDEHVFGYPVPKIETFKTEERDGLPCFTKTVISKVYFAAGWYGIEFDNGGWMESFCPKLSTLRKYKHIGPFKTESDMEIAVRRKLRTDE
jgi:hypothetical protein